MRAKNALTMVQAHVHIEGLRELSDSRIIHYFFGFHICLGSPIYSSFRHFLVRLAQTSCVVKEGDIATSATSDSPGLKPRTVKEEFHYNCHIFGLDTAQHFACGKSYTLFYHALYHTSRLLLVHNGHQHGLLPASFL